MTPFTFELRLPRVVFGLDAMLQLPAEVSAQGGLRVLVLSTPQQVDHARRVASLLGPRAVATFDQAAMHVPVTTVEAASACARNAAVDFTVAIGGGSTIGLAKALALMQNLPFIAIPTTYAGSEMTPIYGLTDANGKRTGRDPKALARVALYDPLLSIGLPVGLSVTSGINAMAHAIEGMYAADGNPMLSLMAEEGVRAVASAIEGLVAHPSDPDLRSRALYGAWLCGAVLGNSAMGLHHKLCHILGGTFDLPHSEVHTVILPHVLAYNAPAIGAVVARIAAALGHGPEASAPRLLFELAQRCGAAVALRHIGMKAADLDTVAELALQQRYPNPRPLERAPIRGLLQRAYEGIPPD